MSSQVQRPFQFSWENLTYWEVLSYRSKFSLQPVRKFWPGSSGRRRNAHWRKQRQNLTNEIKIKVLKVCQYHSRGNFRWGRRVIWREWTKLTSWRVKRDLSSSGIVDWHNIKSKKRAILRADWGRSIRGSNRLRALTGWEGPRVRASFEPRSRRRVLKQLQSFLADWVCKPEWVQLRSDK